MQRYKGYLIVSDLDGTLINSEQYISKQNIEAISYFVKEGGLFAVATGRTELNVKPFIKSIDINCPCILYNGSVIYDLDKKQFIKSAFLDKMKFLEPLKEILSVYKNLCMQIFTQGKMFIVSGCETIDPVVIREKQIYDVACLEDVIKEDWIKIIFRDTNQALKSAEQFLKDRIAPGIFNGVFSTSTYLELLAPGVSKGSALLDLMGIMSVDREKAVAIGDYCNDLEMIRAAGLGVATANAHQALKDTADVITVSNDEHAIHTLIYKVIPEYERELKAHKKHALTTNNSGNRKFSM